MLLLFCLGLNVPSWGLQPADPVVTRSLVRSWHAQHVAEKCAHDFQYGLAHTGSSVAAVSKGEIHALALCDDNAMVQCIAHPPHGELAGHALVMMLSRTTLQVCWERIRSQQRWLIAFTFYDLTNASGARVT